MNSTEISTEIDILIGKLLSGDKRSAARLMTKIETDPTEAREIVKKIHSHTGKAYIIGITGAPGVGKSTLTSVIATEYLKSGKKVGIIAVDPSSQFTGGALLGDRIRMKEHFSNPNIFIRSMANRGYLGGIALATKDCVKVLDAFGCDLIIIETVGVGQSEIEIFKAVHTTIVVVIPEMGDEIQAIKAGIFEITDIFVVNKMDLPNADKQVMDLEMLLNMEHSAKNQIEKPQWSIPIIKINARTGENLPTLIQFINNHREFLFQNNQLVEKLKLRYRSEVLAILKHELAEKIEDFLDGEKMDKELQEIINHSQDPYSCSEEILRNKIVFRD